MIESSALTEHDYSGTKCLSLLILFTAVAWNVAFVGMLLTGVFGRFVRLLHPHSIEFQHFEDSDACSTCWVI